MECILRTQKQYISNKEHLNMLLHNNDIANEIRPAYFLKAMGKDILPMKIFSFGKCNFKCPYCKRNGQYVNKERNIITSINVTKEQLFEKVNQGIIKKQVIRLSGGDPCCYPEVSKKIFEYTKENNGICSIAHNGSSVTYIKSILKYLDFAAIDFKAGDSVEFAKRTGMSLAYSKRAIKNSLEIQKILSENNVLVDVRTCVFGDTTIQDLLNIAMKIYNSGNIKNKFWTIRNYDIVDFCDWKSREINKTIDDIKIVKKYFPKLKIGLRAKWEAEGFLYF